MVYRTRRLVSEGNADRLGDGDWRPPASLLAQRRPVERGISWTFSCKITLANARLFLAQVPHGQCQSRYRVGYRVQLLGKVHTFCRPGKTSPRQTKAQYCGADLAAQPNRLALQVLSSHPVPFPCHILRAKHWSERPARGTQIDALSVLPGEVVAAHQGGRTQRTRFDWLRRWTRIGEKTAPRKRCKQRGE